MQVSRFSWSFDPSPHSLWVIMKALHFFLMSMLFWVGCGSPAPTTGQLAPADTACHAKAAQILVGDGFLQILCGCTAATETAGKIYSVKNNTPLTCHLASSDTKVFFFFMGTVLSHQIVPTGANSFIASPVSDPNSSNPIRAYVAEFPSSNTVYSFQDSYSSMTGQIFVP